MSDTIAFKKCEATFLNSKGVKKGKKRGRPLGRKTGSVIVAMRQSNAEYFSAILTDDTEKQLWMAFITGATPVLDEKGNPIVENGQLKTQALELNPISFKAFLRAVEYKRGMPKISVEAAGDTGKLEMVVINQGAGEDFFLQRAKAAGLLSK